MKRPFRCFDRSPEVIRPKRVRRMKGLQTFSAVHAAFHNHFNPERHLINRETYKAQRPTALVEWQALMA
jgi:putative transposase